MSTRRLLRNLEWGLLALLPAAHFLFWFNYSAISARCPSHANLLYDSVLSAEVALLAGWLVAGPGKWWLRQPAAAIAVAALVGFGLIDWPFSASWQTILLSWEGGMVGLGLGIFRLRGWRLIHVDAHAPLRVRFSLRTLLTIMFAVALTVRFAQWLQSAIAEIGFSARETVMAIAVSIALPIVAAWPAVLGSARPWLPAAGLLMVTPAFGSMVPYLLSNSEELTSLTSWLFLQTLVVVVSLFIVRSAGYHFIKSLPNLEQGTQHGPCSFESPCD